MVPGLQSIVFVGTNFLRMGRFSKGIGTKATTHQKGMAIGKDAPRGRRDSYAERPPGNSPQNSCHGTLR